MLVGQSVSLWVHYEKVNQVERRDHGIVIDCDNDISQIGIPGGCCYDVLMSELTILQSIIHDSITGYEPVSVHVRNQGHPGQ